MKAETEDGVHKIILESDGVEVPEDEFGFFPGENPAIAEIGHLPFGFLVILAWFLRFRRMHKDFSIRGCALFFLGVIPISSQDIGTFPCFQSFSFSVSGRKDPTYASLRIGNKNFSSISIEFKKRMNTRKWVSVGEVRRGEKLIVRH